MHEKLQYVSTGFFRLRGCSLAFKFCGKISVINTKLIQRVEQKKQGQVSLWGKIARF